MVDLVVIVCVGLWFGLLSYGYYEMLWVLYEWLSYFVFGFVYVIVIKVVVVLL